mmetsp:Transcript_62918/g.142195  ORF Transcript_62918/g.142195 Transcript_62918/m.142195 type:complete len:130 (-) Transcript_62918:88-477(-)
MQHDGSVSAIEDNLNKKLEIVHIGECGSALMQSPGQGTLSMEALQALNAKGHGRDSDVPTGAVTGSSSTAETLASIGTEAKTPLGGEGAVKEGQRGRASRRGRGRGVDQLRFLSTSVHVNGEEVWETWA